MPTILIVDDEQACREPLARLLKIEGYEVAEAADGVEALQRLNEQKFDLVLLDLVMPVMDGITFIKKVRADAKFADLPIFLVTAVHDSAVLTRAREMGIQQYLFKGDVPFMRMLELIKAQLGESFTPVRRGRRPKGPPVVRQVPSDSTGLNVLVDRGRASPEEIAEFLAEVSILYRMMGGSGITFTLNDVRHPSEELV